MWKSNMHVPVTNKSPAFIRFHCTMKGIKSLSFIASTTPLSILPCKGESYSAGEPQRQLRVFANPPISAVSSLNHELVSGTRYFLLGIIRTPFTAVTEIENQSIVLVMILLL
jgi:hypothetical protein